MTGPHGMPDEVRAAADVVLDTPLEAARALSALARPRASRAWSASRSQAGRADPTPGQIQSILRSTTAATAAAADHDRGDRPEPARPRRH